MRENINFISLRNQLGKDGKEVGNKDTGADSAFPEMSHRDHFLSMRQAISGFVDQQSEEEWQEERIKQLKEIISTELQAKYQDIIRNFRDKSEKSKAHPEREFIDIGEEELSHGIEDWIASLRNEVLAHDPEASTEDLAGLEAECWFFLIRFRRR
jgi:hypothetical protein